MELTEKFEKSNKNDAPLANGNGALFDFKAIEEAERNGFVRKLKDIEWLYWLNRPYSVFMATIFWEGLRHKYFEKNGFKGFGPDNAFYQFPDIYYDKKFLENGLLFFGEYFKDHKVSDLSNSLAAMHKHHLVEIEKITNDGKKTPPQKTSAMSELVKDYMPYLWIIIQLEVYFDKRVAREVPKYIKGDYSKFVGDICVPRKKNAYVLMQDEIRSGVAAEVIQKKYGWIKSRDGFTDFFTVKEIEEIKNDLKDVKSPDVAIPDGLSDLAKELKELNFFRTDRTDKFYEFFGAARPLMLEVAKYVGVDFKTLADYDAISIISGQPKKYNKNFSYGLLGNRYFVTNDLIIADFKNSQNQEVKGNVAFKGVVRGIAKIVTHPNDIGKVGEGDVLVAQMTFPSFISAMQKSVAFVTDEGGITCHAAIIAREMKKPCIIGTKNGTKLLRDGDLIEVDADNGVVRVIKKAEAAKNDPLNLTDQYLKLIGKRKLYPPLNGYSAFLQGSEYNTQRYFKKWYEDRVGYSLLVLMKKGYSQVWLPEEDFMVAAEYALHEYLKDHKFFARRNDHLLENIKKIDVLYDRYTYRLINESNWETLFSLVNEVRDLIWDANAAVNFTVFLDKQLCAEILKREKYPITEKELDILWEKAVEPAFESFDKSQLRNFLKLVKENTSWEMIKEQCQYILSDYHSAKTLTEIEDVLNERYAKYIDQPVLASQALDTENEQVEKIVAAHERWFSGLPENEQVIAHYLQTVMKMRDRRKNFFAKGMTIIYRVAEKMFAEAKIGREFIPYYTVHELLKGVEYLKTNSRELASRPDGFEWLVPYSGEVKAQSRNIDSEIEKINKYFKDGHTIGGAQNTIHGQPAFKGQVRGRVRVVLNVNSNAQFIDGEILVAGMTRPEYVPLMKKASGIVTDEGGITCHAAIVSRELKIPCITGTKIATKVLQDGDLVEVDANTGVVKIIEKAKQTIENKPIDFKDRKWVVYGVTGYPAYLTPHLYVPSRGFFQKYGITNEGIGLWKGKVMDWLYDESQLVELAEKLLPDLLKRKWEYFDLWKIKADEFHALHYKLYSLDVSKLDDEELKEWIKKYYDAFVSQYSENNFIEPLSFYFQNHLKAMLVKEELAEAEAERLAGLYGAPSKPNYIKECIKEFKAAKNAKALAAVLKKFHFINNDYTGPRPVTKDDLKHLALKHGVTSSPKIKKDGLTERANDLLEVLQMTATIQDLRKAESLMWVGGAAKLLAEAAKRKNISMDEAVFVTWDEVMAENFDRAELKRRKEHCVMDWQAKATKIYSGGDAVKIIADFRHSILGTVDEITELKGFAASHGRVTGRAVVVLNVSQFNTVNKGDILVASMTRPEYLPIMHLAAAFVTDEGGITSHAAIVAREMKKPCVIATKIATKVIHDGDLLEVDADKGIVKILKIVSGASTDERPLSTEAEDDINKFANLKYHYIHNRMRAPIFTYLLWEGVCHRHNKQTKFDYPIRNIIYLDSDLAIDEAEWDKKAKMTDRLFKQDKNLLNKLMTQARRVEAAIGASVKRLKKTKKINAAVAKELARFFEKTYQFGAFVLFALLAENSIEKRLRAIVEKRFGKGHDDIFQVLTSPLDLSAVQENELGILKLANLPKRDAKKAISRHLAKYAWLKNGPYNGTFYSLEDIIAEIKKISKPKEALAKYLSGIMAKRENFDKYYKQLSKEEKSLVLSSLGSINFRSWRTERYYAHGFELDSIFRKLGEKFGLEDYQDIFYLTPPEMIDLLKADSLADQRLINERKRGYVMVTDKASTRIYSGPSVAEFKKRINVKSVETSAPNEIKGQVAFSGIATGRARIINKKADLAAVQDGEILVTEMTTPDFVPFLKKIIGIVTNEGGITCHAAIIAREMKKPCVIGTKIATQIIKTGDLVEVDAERGIVTIKGGNAITLTKTFSREKPLLYFLLWNDSDRRGWKKFLGYDVKNNFFIVPPPGRKGSVWYSPAELAEVEALLKNKLASDPAFIASIVKTFDSDWQKLSPYLLEDKKIGSVKEFHDYYEWLVDWWSAMTAVFTVPDIKEVSEDIRTLILKYRAASEKYTEKMSRLLTEFWDRRYPELKGFSFCIAPSEVKNFTPAEKRVFVDKIRARAAGCIMLNEKIYPLSELDALLAKNDLVLEQHQAEANGEIKGRIAFQGIVTGKVKKILSFADMKDFKAGEVLVTEMTNPEYLPIMKIALAVVTDEGGATCHAAIASRELKIPCIVATRVATHVLNDGDLVEVDADKGIVKILQSAAGSIDSASGGLTALDKEIWSDSFNWKYAAYPFYTSVYAKLNTPAVNEYETQWKYFLNKFSNAQLDAYLPKKEILQTGKKIIDELLAGNAQFVKDLKKYYLRMDKAIGLCEQNKIHSSADFRTAWKQIKDALSGAAKILYDFDYGLDEYFKGLQAFDPDLFKKLNSNIVGEKESFINEANRRLLELSAEYFEDFPRIYNKFISEYGWIQNSYKGPAVITKEWLKDHLGEIKNAIAARPASKEKLAEKYSLFVAAADLAVSFRDDKKKLLLLAVGIMDKWLSAVCAENNLKKSEMLWLSVDEIFLIIDRRDNFLAARAKQYAERGVRYGVMSSVGYDDVSESLWSAVVKLNQADTGAVLIKGMAGNKGKVRGRVRIVLDLEKEGKNFLDGEILVTSMTRPEYLSLMSKAAAFVTNEGGITCHAAIVAREMNKPCVIGTRTATQVLRNGDLVEVDADQGIVRII